MDNEALIHFFRTASPTERLLMSEKARFRLAALATIGSVHLAADEPAARQPQSDLVRRLREMNGPVSTEAADRIEALEAAAAQPSQGGEFERVDFYRLAKAFDVTIEKVHAAVGFTGYLYRQLTVPRAPTQPSREAESSPT